MAQVWMERGRNYARTIEAIRRYDKHQGVEPDPMVSVPLYERWMARDESLARAVGYAFGLDTRDINSPVVCERTIRPGPVVPSPGYAESFVRRMARLHHDAAATPL